MGKEQRGPIGRLKDKLIPSYESVDPLLSLERLNGLDDEDRDLLLHDRTEILNGLAQEGHEPRVYKGEVDEPISMTMYRLSLIGEDNPLFQYAQAVATDEEFEEFMALVRKNKRIRK